MVANIQANIRTSLLDQLRQNVEHFRPKVPLFVGVSDPRPAECGIGRRQHNRYNKRQLDPLSRVATIHPRVQPANQENNLLRAQIATTTRRSEAL